MIFQIVADGMDPKQQTFFFWYVALTLLQFVLQLFDVTSEVCCDFLLLYLKFMLSSKPLRRRKRPDLVQNSKHVHPLVLDPDFHTSMNELNDRVNGNDDPFFFLFPLHS